jgi:hypothetical protein
VRPALFWTMGRRAAKWTVKHEHHEPDLTGAATDAQETAGGSLSRVDCDPRGQHAAPPRVRPADGHTRTVQE